MHRYIYFKTLYCGRMGEIGMVSEVASRVPLLYISNEQLRQCLCHFICLEIVDSATSCSKANLTEHDNLISSLKYVDEIRNVFDEICYIYQ